jgi:hypothetical protein
VRVPAWQYLFAALVVAASIGYSVVCVVALAAVASLRSLAAQVLAGQHPDPLTIQARLRAVSNTANAVNGLWLFMFVLFVAWLVSVNRRYAATGQPLSIGRAARFALFSGGVVSIILTAYAVRSTGVRTVADAHRVATIDMTFLAVRAAVGIVYAWCALALLAARKRSEPPVPAPVAGSDLSYEEYIAMRAAQRSAPPASPTNPAAIPPSASAGEITLDAPNG